MKFNPFTKVAAAIGVLALWGFTPEAQASLADLTTGGTATINGAIFTTINFQPASSSLIQPFVRIQNTGDEAGYNTSLGAPLDDVSGAFDRDLPLATALSVTVGGITYYDFRLNLNQPSGGDKSKISLNQVEIFGRNNSAPATGVTMDPTTGRVSSGTILGTLLYDMNSAAAPNGNSVLLDYNLNKGGSGKGDMELLVPTSALSGFQDLVFYSQFGKPPGIASSEGGFEEWSVIDPPVVPEPATVVAGLLLLLPFGASMMRLLCRNLNLKAIV